MKRTFKTKKTEKAKIQELQSIGFTLETSHFSGGGRIGF